MAVTDVTQVEVNGLTLGPGTAYQITEFNPYTRSVRFTEADRAWAPGSWSGREDSEAVAIPLRLFIDTADGPAWVAAQQTLMSALRPSNDDVECRWKIGATEYLMFVRPRLVEPNTEQIVHGRGHVGCALMALDPRVYSATEHAIQMGLPSTTGGLTAPITAPFEVAATITSGRAQLTNAGNTDTALLLRIDAFGDTLVDPRISLTVGSTVKVLRVNLTLSAGQWMEIDTGARTVYLNGTSSRRGNVSGEFFLLPPGTSDIAFDAGIYSSVAQLTATWRDSWT